MMKMDEEVRRAIRDVEVARNHFDWCDKEYVEAAAYQLAAAEARLNIVLKSRKKVVAA